MGGGDLNLKKSWHTGTIKNQEKVWKREQAAQEEQTKLDELRKELAQEREREELQGLQVKAGLKTQSQKLDWMYAAGPGQAQSTKSADLEAFLLGKRRVDTLLNTGDEKKLSAASDSTFLSQVNSKANSKRDVAAKIREDPLLAIRRREQTSIESVINNPMKMKEMERERERRKREKKEIKQKRKEEKRRGDSTVPTRSSTRDGSDRYPRNPCPLRYAKDERGVSSRSSTRDGADRYPRNPSPLRYVRDERGRVGDYSDSRNRTSTSPGGKRTRRSSSPPRTRERESNRDGESRRRDRGRGHY